ncbi:MULTISPECIES: GNAT family N-acetyltransferase [Streptomyces]|uniref:GCN5 family acetyltransferase n=2 Tax=Streptomyces TaxID=1883 RepID=A0A0W7X3V3_9ACTN|nr:MULTISPECIES: GNAT family protein [Streptomyces]KUF17503.1 GCN5 family acetyltransferase [Streptomyces silvensis]MVO83915.1 GNAT family N-acetyltransferase [Streptomyces typhae]
MERSPAPDIRLTPWSEGDFDLLVRHNAPEMTAHLGGPESDEKLLDRHRRYVGLEGSRSGWMFRIATGPEGKPAGIVGFWETAHRGEDVWEAGWGVLPEFQGQGIAAAAVRLVVAEARGTQARRHLHAFPSVENAASNGVCRKAGFVLLGEEDMEYPKGHWMRCNDWRIDLTQE